MGFEPTKAKPLDLKSSPFDQLWNQCLFLHIPGFERRMHDRQYSSITTKPLHCLYDLAVKKNYILLY